MHARRPLTANSGRIRIRIALALALVASSALVGCVDASENSGSLYDGQPNIAGSPANGTGSDGVASQQSANPADQNNKTAALTPPGQPTPIPKIDADPKRLIGLDRDALIALLGKPSFKRKDNPAEFWRYNSDSCMLDLYLYGPAKPTAKDKAVRVRHVAAHGPNDAPVDTSDCLRTILRARLTSDSG